MRNFISLIVLAIALSSCAKDLGQPSLPESSHSLLGYCAQAPNDLQSAGFSSETRSEFLKQNKVLQVTDITDSYLTQFAFELAKFPEQLRSFLNNNDIGFHLVQGRGVSEDPSFPNFFSQTFDGRSWANVPGSGSADVTRVVVNRLYEGHGSVNLVLHERAHTLDSNLGNVSSTSQWNAVLSSDSSFREILGKYCGDYCLGHSNEAFAEGFAIYYSCEKSKNLLASAGMATSFFDRLDAPNANPNQ